MKTGENNGKSVREIHRRKEAGSMKNLWNSIREMLKIRRRAAAWRRVITVAAAFIVFVTTYALILPAITIDRTAAEMAPGIVLESIQGKKSKDKSTEEETTKKKKALKTVTQKLSPTMFKDEEIVHSIPLPFAAASSPQGWRT